MTDRTGASRTNLEEDLKLLVFQEDALQFSHFDPDVAWSLGSRIRARAQVTTKAVAIGIWMGGQTVFYTGTTGVTPGNEDWLRRKRNTVLRFCRSSLRVGVELAKAGTTLEEKQGLAQTEYAAHGGGFPILLRGTGCVGAIVVSGLTQREDHALVVEAIAQELQVPVTHLS